MDAKMLFLAGIVMIALSVLNMSCEREEPAKEQAVKEEPTKEQVVKEEPQKESPAMEEPLEKPPAMEELVKEEAWPKDWPDKPGKDAKLPQDWPDEGEDWPAPNEKHQ